MKCPVCVDAGLRSTVTQGTSTSTLLYSAPYYDEDGDYHNHDANGMTTTYNCSNGHSFSIFTQRGCKKCGIAIREEVRVS